MTKADIVKEIAQQTGAHPTDVLQIVESMMKIVKETVSKGDNVYLRGFGSFIIKKRAEKTARNISKNTVVIVPAHEIPAFKPAPVFVEKLTK